MEQPEVCCLYTIGHSTHEVEAFLELLRMHDITAVADVRSSPYSQYNPQFNRETFHADLQAAGVDYVFLGDQLGPRSDDPGCMENGKASYKRIAQTANFQHGRTSPVNRSTPELAVAISGEELREELNRIFGFHDFRRNQERIVSAILTGQDTLAVMPTGSGKSLCYQLPASLLPGTCVVVSPLIALMKDQVDAAVENGLRAAYYNSSQGTADRMAVLQDLEAGNLDLLYVSPERLGMEAFLNHLKRCRISLFAIDEAHCISEWGHDFRPDYLFLGDMVREFREVPVAAFTATATAEVQSDIVQRLSLRSPHLVRASFDRPNLFYSVVPKWHVGQQILDFIQSRPGESGIVYRATRAAVEDTAALLIQRGVRALPYHAGLDSGTRQEHQEKFNRDEVDVIVATIAFGMGIDKSNVRFVVHGDLPKNLESYYQETGRAGRDGEPAQCTLFYSSADTRTIRYFIDQMQDWDERKRCLKKLNEMIAFASATTCRRQQLLAYFEETYAPENCATCDVCCDPVERMDATTDAQLVLTTIVQTNQRFGMKMVVDIVTGAKTKRVREWNLDRVETYSQGDSKTKRYWHHVIDQLVGHNCLARAWLYRNGAEQPLSVSELAPFYYVAPHKTRRRARKGSEETWAGRVAMRSVLVTSWAEESKYRI